MTTHDEMKAGNLYLYNMDPKIDKDGRYVDMPVIALSENSHLRELAKINPEYPTWLCLLPNKTFGGFYPCDMVDITMED